MDAGNGMVGIWIASIVLFAVIGGAIWRQKGGNVAFGALIGALLGLIGIGILVFVKPSANEPAAHNATRECPHCKSQMRRDASVCPHCRRDSEPWTFHQGFWWVERPSGRYYLDEKTGQWVVSDEETSRPRHPEGIPSA